MFTLYPTPPPIEAKKPVFIFDWRCWDDPPNGIIHHQDRGCVNPARATVNANGRPFRGLGSRVEDAQQGKTRYCDDVRVFIGLIFPCIVDRARYGREVSIPKTPFDGSMR